MENYRKAMEIFEKIQLLSSISSVLYWDTNTSLPAQGIQYRSEQTGYISELIHGLQTSDELINAVKAANAEKLDEEQRRDLEILDRQIRIGTALPDKFVKRQTAQANTTLEIWKKAKGKSDFSIVLPELEKSFQLNYERGILIGKAIGIDHPFEALLNVREPGMTVDSVSQLFQRALAFLKPLTKKYAEKSAELRTDRLDFLVKKSVQKQIVKEIARFYRYPFEGDRARGRIDEVEHPLTISCGPDDVRVTVKYNEPEFTRSIFAACHELGHALDRLNRNPEWMGRPIDSFRTPSIAECYSRFTENKVGKSSEFWQYFFPILQEHLPQLKDMQWNEFYALTNLVNPNPSRLRADELTYLTHIIIRFEIEKMLFEDKISIQDLPGIWNEKYSEYLGVEVPNDAEGVLQDLHWYSVYWAYFQGYGLGDLMGSQLLQKVDHDVPDWRDNVRMGDISILSEWLASNAFSLAGRYDPMELIQQITGIPLSVDAHKKYLNVKYYELFTKL